jgi:hypothetical protein
MEALIIISGLIGSIVTLALTASTWGADSRDPMPDAHLR